MPPIGLLLGKIDFASLFVVLDQSKGVPASLAKAKTKGIPVVAYGAFINDVVILRIPGQVKRSTKIHEAKLLFFVRFRGSLSCPGGTKTLNQRAQPKHAG